MVAARGAGTTHKEAGDCSNIVNTIAAKQSRIFPRNFWNCSAALATTPFPNSGRAD
ncbi:hypothetical protein CDS [Bradyrhizobium sp.]|nr:hypothetical protein CDS [Bradyrhizobium sp.]